MFFVVHFLGICILLIVYRSDKMIVFLFKLVIFAAIGYGGYALIFWLLDAPVLNIFLHAIKDWKYGPLIIGGVLILGLIVRCTGLPLLFKIYIGAVSIGIAVRTIQTYIRER